MIGGRVEPLEDGIRHFILQEQVDEVSPLITFVLPEDVRNSAFKQVFLPERWPTVGVLRDALIAGLLGQHAQRLPAPPPWRDVMVPTGWDNAINRMATKYSGNIQVHAIAGIERSVTTYLLRVRLHEGTPRMLLSETTLKRPRPLAISNDDYCMCMDIRVALGVQIGDPTCYPPNQIPWSPNVFALHCFLVRHGCGDRSYLPIATRGRKYCYVDAKITKAMLAQLKRSNKNKSAGEKPLTKKGKGSQPEPEPEPEPDEQVEQEQEQSHQASECVGDLLGFTPIAFNKLNQDIRRQVRGRLRADKHHPGRHTYERDKPKRRQARKRRKQRRQRIRERVKRLGTGRMPARGRVDSFETDGIGLRLCLKSPVMFEQYVQPLPLQPPPHPSPLTRVSKKNSTVKAASPGEAAPIMVGVDTGRAKLFAAAVSHHACKKPESVVFTRRQYYASMGYWRQQKWSQARGTSIRVQEALAALALAGGLKSCDEARWTAALDAEKQHEEILKAEYEEETEYALWRMRLFRKKRQSLDRAMHGLLRSATHGEAVVHVQIAWFAATSSQGFAPV
ncbi:hypothetical protein TSOC_013487 [Tetrabaena socialis]|uniref:Uncharacterized protein n=1 Tax=Tetrabaena socialis TaxID=47790 RepID=A0A2J7ZK76_9CHLO|nr:hypothetical protein TSOC_013487 [Tetrabaena socialis]|eukprot:PNH00676.1 hypothetical protein TSOC_013487 [Tetrabaena socialis]